MNDSPNLNDDPALDDSALFNVGQLLTGAAANWPDHPAIAEPDGKGWRQVSFAQLESDTNQIAAGL